jgi:hypothetical protein
MSKSPYNEYDFEGMPYTGQIHPDDRDFDERLADRNRDGRLSSWERAIGNQVSRGTRQHKSGKFWGGWGDKDSRLFHRGRYYEQDAELPRGFLGKQHSATGPRILQAEGRPDWNRTGWVFPALAVALIGFMSMPLWRGKLTSAAAEGGSGCGCEGCPSCKEAEKETEFHSEYSLERVNPIIVEGAEDVFGAETLENVAPTRGINFYGAEMQMPPIPQAYQTPTGVTTSVDAMFYDPENDFMPEYRFPAPWSPSYNPRDSFRPADYQTYGSYSPRVLGQEY